MQQFAGPNGALQKPANPYQPRQSAALRCRFLTLLHVVILLSSSGQLFSRGPCFLCTAAAQHLLPEQRTFLSTQTSETDAAAWPSNSLELGSQSYTSQATDSQAPEIQTLEEGRALLQFKAAITSDPKGITAGWLEADLQNLCDWRGVECDLDVANRVVGIDLTDGGLEVGHSEKHIQAQGTKGVCRNFEVALSIYYRSHP